MLIKPSGTYFSDVLFKIQKFSFKEMHLKMLPAKWRSFWLGLNVSTQREIHPIHVKVAFPVRDNRVIFWVPMQQSCRIWVKWTCARSQQHDDVIKWNHFPRYRPFVRWPVDSPHKGPVTPEAFPLRDVIMEYVHKKQQWRQSWHCDNFCFSVCLWACCRSQILIKKPAISICMLFSFWQAHL